MSNVVEVTEENMVVRVTEEETTVVSAGIQGAQGTPGQGVPTGGTTGQFLKKSSITNYDTAWASILQSDVTGLETSLSEKAALSHTHAINDVTGLQNALDAKQSIEPTLTALAAYNTDGILVQTAADTFTGRSIVGTSNQVTVTNGNGVAGNPTLSLPQDIHSGATPSFAGMTLDGTLSSRSVIPTPTATYNLGSSTNFFFDAYVSSVHFNAAVSIDGIDSARLTVLGASNTGVTSLLNLNNPSTGSAAGSGLLVSAGSTSSFVGGLGWARTDASNNSTLFFRVMSNGTFTSNSTSAPLFVQGAATNIVGVNGEFNVYSSGTSLVRISSAGSFIFNSGFSVSQAGTMTFPNGQAISAGTGTGLKIGTTTAQKLGLWNVTPTAQPTTAVTSATRVGGGGTTLTDTDTFDGYTIAQVVKALRNFGALA